MKKKILPFLLIGIIALTGITPSITTQAANTDSQDTYVVVLDPGHGRSGSGTYRDYGDFVIDEAVINYKISQYTKTSLENDYDNIVVYMTKETQNANPSIANRVALAVEKNADVFVSQHVNSTGTETTTANGVLGIVPTVDESHAYHKESALLSQKLARKILDQLVGLGFKDNDFLYKLSGDNTRYPDGSLADYYGVVRECREENIPGIIIEHGFANNTHDANILKDEDMLKKIGEADALGIIEYLKEHAGYTPTPEAPPVTPPSDGPFVDTYDTEYYYDAVVWAVEHNITTGLTETYFGVGESCTRAQGLTFLWRFQTCPPATTQATTFEDIDHSEFYYDAVCWGVENNITTGYNSTTFGPSDSLTRAQFVTFLWRTEGCPEPTTTENPFSDVTEADYFYKAVLWAVENDITTGTSETTFEPDKECLREQVVTFLWRADSV